MRTLLTSLLLVTTVLLPAQETGISILPAPAYTELKQYLGLTDAQVQSLETILRNRSQAQQAVFTQISEKSRQMYQLLENGSGSATQIGQLMLDIRNLEKQLSTVDAPYRTQAVNVLTADQKTKLAKLDEALKLQGTASQAAMLLLLEYPYPIGLPRPVDFGGGIGNSGIGVITGVSGVSGLSGRAIGHMPALRKP
jgi:Spy/CpxP family protein refolding chaperone